MINELLAVEDLAMLAVMTESKWLAVVITTGVLAIIFVFWGLHLLQAKDECKFWKQMNDNIPPQAAPPMTASGACGRIDLFIPTKEGVTIRRENFETALKITIERLEERERMMLVRDFKSGLRAGLEEVLAASQRGEHIEVKDEVAT